MKRIVRFTVSFLILLSVFLPGNVVFATDGTHRTIQASSLISDVNGSGYSYRASDKTLTLTSGSFVLEGKVGVEYNFFVKISGNVSLEIRNLTILRDKGSDFSAGDPVIAVDANNTLKLRFLGNCNLRGGALSSGILLNDKTTLEITPAAPDAYFSCGPYRFGGAGIAVDQSSHTATVKLDTSTLKSGHITLAGGERGVNNTDGLAVNLGKGKLYVNGQAVTSIRRAMRWTADKVTDVYAVYVENGVASTWFAAIGEKVSLRPVMESGQFFEKWFADPMTPADISDENKQETTLTVSNHDTLIYAVLYRKDGVVLDVYNITMRGGEADALASNAGEIIEINASTFMGKKFVGWSYEGPTEVKFEDPTAMSTTFVMPKGDIIVVAVFEDEGIPIIVDGGKASRERAIPGTVITITAMPPENMVFYQWKVVKGKDSAGKTLKLQDKKQSVTTFVMIDTEVEIRAEYIESPRTVKVIGGIADKTMADKGESITLLARVSDDEIFRGWEVVYISSSGRETKSAKNYSDPFTTVLKERQEITRITAIVDKKKVSAITVAGGSADKAEAAAGTAVTLVADLPDGHRFLGWSSEDGIVFSNQNSVRATFVMPESPVSVTAVTEAFSASSPGIILGIGSSDATVDGVKKKLKNPVIKTDGGATLLPLFSLLDCLGIQNYFEYNDLIEVDRFGDKLEFLVNSCEISHSGNREVLSYPFCRIDGVYYLSDLDFSRLFGYVLSKIDNTVTFTVGNVPLVLHGGFCAYDRIPAGVWVDIFADVSEGKHFSGWSGSEEVVFENASSPNTRVMVFSQSAEVSAAFSDVSESFEIETGDGYTLVTTDFLVDRFIENLDMTHTMSVLTQNRHGSTLDALSAFLGERANNVFIAKETVSLTENTVYSLGELKLSYNEETLSAPVQITLEIDSLDSGISSLARAPIAIVCAYVEGGSTQFSILTDLDTSCDTVTFLANHIGVYYLLFDSYGLKPTIPYLNIDGILEKEKGVVSLSGVSSSLGLPLTSRGFAYRVEGEQDWQYISVAHTEAYCETIFDGIRPDTRYEFCMYAKTSDGETHVGNVYLLISQPAYNGLFSDIHIVPIIGLMLLAAGIWILFSWQKKQSR